MHSIDRGRNGFALALVVFMLFAAAVAGMTGYQIVSAEADLASGNENADEAMAVANAGLERYIGEHIGIPGSSTYVVGDGSVTITPRRMAALDDSTDLYLLSSVGTVTDPRYPTSPARRTTRLYARLNRRPVKMKAAFLTIQDVVSIGNQGSARVDGRATIENSSSADCPSGDNSGVGNIGGIGSLDSGIGGNQPTGSPAVLTYASIGAVTSAAGLRWSVLKDATFPIPYDGTWPNFASIPSDSFPVIRVNGSYTLDRSGRGALIVTGNFSASSGTNFVWRGLILAGGAVSGSFQGASGNGNQIRGVVVSGLNGSQFSGNQQVNRMQIDYYPCWSRRANLALAYLSPVDRSLVTY